MPNTHDEESAGLNLDASTDKTVKDATLDLIRDIEVDLKEALPEQQQKEVIRVVSRVVESKAAFFAGPQPPSRVDRRV